MQRTKDLISLLAVILEDYCTANNIPIENAFGFVAPNTLLDYVKENAPLWGDDVIQEMLNRAEVMDTAYAMALQMCDDPLGANKLAGLWQQVVLKHRGVPEHSLETMQLAVLLKWKDGKVAPIVSTVPCEGVNADSIFDDGTLCTMIQMTAHSIMEVVENNGLDKIYNSEGVLADNEAYEILMGLIVRLKQGAVIVANPGDGERAMAALNAANIPCAWVDPALRERVENVQRCLQRLFRMPIPHQLKQPRGEQPTVPTPDKPESGWK